MNDSSENASTTNYQSLGDYPMSPTLKKAVAFSSALLLSACGGGGSGGDGSQRSATESDPSNLPSTGQRELVFKFADAPLDPTVFNVRAQDPDPDNHFAPNEDLDIVWETQIFYSDNTTIRPGDQFSYSAEIYISNDDELQPETDVLAFSSECQFPDNNQAACSNYGSLSCTYAPNNQNLLSCTSFPLNRAEGVVDFESDLTPILTQIPKQAYVIGRMTLTQDPTKTNLFVLPIQFN